VTNAAKRSAIAEPGGVPARLDMTQRCYRTLTAW
jgi:hypothetical protein